MVSQKIIRISLLVAFAGLVSKAILKGIGLPESIVILGLMGFEGYLQFLTSRRNLEVSDEFKSKLSSLESKLAAMSVLKRMG